MKTAPTNREPQMIRRVIVAAREGAMQCPRCEHVLSYSDVLLCRVGETHYCPRCWSRIPNHEVPKPPESGGPHDATSGADGAPRSEAKDDDEAHIALPED